MRVFPMMLLLVCPVPNDEEVGWKSAVLWKNDVVSARILFKPSASLADKEWLGLEFENHTREPLEFGQTWMNLNMTLKEISSGKVLTTSGLSGTVNSIKKLPPGRHRFFGDTFQYASANMGLPPVTGLSVNVQANIDTEITAGTRYKTPADGAPFTFEWRCPTADEETGMSKELKTYLANQNDSEKRLPRLSALLKSPRVVESLTLEDYLPAIKACRDPNFRRLLVPNLFTKYRDDPHVLAYYREAFQNEPEVVVSDAAASNVWNEEFLEPLIQGCEKNRWYCFSVLKWHASEWRNKPSCVVRISAALLKHYPILQREVRTIPESELELWAKGVVDASGVPDQSLVDLLKPALEDQRPATIDYGAGGKNAGRVCDRALYAILSILDDDWWAAFKDAGIAGWSTEDERRQACDKVISLLNERLKSLPMKK